MPKLFTQNTWSDEVLSGSERYDILEDDGSAYKADMQISLVTPVTTAGTSVTAERMNNLEAGIAAIDFVQGRLTLESGVAVSTTDQTAKTSLYYTPYGGNRISLYTGTIWEHYSFTEKSLSLSGYTAGKNYDIFGYISSGELALESLVWTNDSTRGTALTTQNGILVKSGATTRRYLGTIRITGTTGQCESSISKRFVYNYYNRVSRGLQVTGSTSHTNTNTSAAMWNSDSTMMFEFVTGVTEDQCFITLLNDSLCAATSSSSQGCVGLGINSTSTLSAVSYWANAHRARSSNNTIFTPSTGYNYIALLERGLTGVTFYVAQSSMLLNG